MNVRKIEKESDFLFLAEEMSAKKLWRKETKKIAAVAILALIVSAYLIFHYWGVGGIAIGISAVGAIFYLTVILLRFIFFIFSLKRMRSNSRQEQEIALPSEDEFPVYTILVPLRHEEKILQGLISSLGQLDWPKDKLQIMLLVDDDDDITLRALEKHKIPSCFEVVVISTKGTSLRSKPRVLNAALSCVSGEFLTIYDAEDKPEPNQLKKAYAAFRNSPEEVVCIQARLDYYNEDRNLLTRWFTAEYSSWFCFTLPALDYLGFPVPLGGTSNHIKTDFLKKIGGWDPYNVTEDCDLGMRIYRMKGKTRIMSYLPHEARPVRVFDSITYEEASSSLGNWIRQRSRWIKGFMVTFIVHFRHPLQTLRDFGLRGFAIFSFFTLGTAIVHLCNIAFWIIFLSWFLFGAPFVSMFFPPELLRLHMFSLIFGNGLIILMQVIAPLTERRYVTAFVSIITPVYWLLMAVACLKAVYEIFVKPHYWQKTVHLG